MPVYFGLSDDFRTSALGALVMDSRRLRRAPLCAVLDAKPQFKPAAMTSHEPPFEPVLSRWGTRKWPHAKMLQIDYPEFHWT
jgi:hypothetical protein